MLSQVLPFRVPSSLAPTQGYTHGVVSDFLQATVPKASLFLQAPGIQTGVSLAVCEGFQAQASVRPLPPSHSQQSSNLQTLLPVIGLGQVLGREGGPVWHEAAGSLSKAFSLCISPSGTQWRWTGHQNLFQMLGLSGRGTHQGFLGTPPPTPIPLGPGSHVPLLEQGDQPWEDLTL